MKPVQGAWMKNLSRCCRVFSLSFSGRTCAARTAGRGARSRDAVSNTLACFLAAAMMSVAPICLAAAIDPALEADWQRQARSHAGPATLPGKNAKPVEETQIHFDVELNLSIDRGRHLAADLAAAGVDVSEACKELDALAATGVSLKTADEQRDAYLRCRGVVRTLALSNPLLNFDSLIFAKRKPGIYSHMSDQYYSWWSRPGGGICLLQDIKSDHPRMRCLTESLAEGSFLGPDVSFDAKTVLFAYCRYYPDRSKLKDKVDKDSQPEDSFYHVFEMNVDGSGLRQITHGRYDDTFARYLPDGRIIFLSTRRGQTIQCGKASAESSLTTTLPDSFVRCGGGPSRPVSIYTLHTMDRNGTNLVAVSAFESFEWDPNVAEDGRIFYSRWDYIDRDNMPYMKLWATQPDGSNPQIVFGNYTRNPYSVFESRSIPGSRKIIATASAHHSITGGSLILIDPTLGIQDGPTPLTRLTPEVCFPESEGWPTSFYANPYPLSEKYYLVGWSDQGLMHEGQKPNLEAATGLYFYDSFGNKELLYRDEQISSGYPIPLRPRTTPPARGGMAGLDGPQEGRFLLQDIYAGMDGVGRGSVKALRIVAMPIKTQPNMNSPAIGITRDDPGKCVLGTVPVESDGSAFFRVPSGVAVFFQAIDEQNRAVQTMRSLTYVQPGQTLACIGCHERRSLAPQSGATARLLAAARAPSRITPGPVGSWPLRYDRLVQPVLDSQCVSCHAKGAADSQVAKLDLTPERSYDALVHYGKPSLDQQVHTIYRQGYSTPGQGGAQQSALLALLQSPSGHHGVCLDQDAVNRLTLWMDLYAQKQGMFSPQQEQQLMEFHESVADLLTPGGAVPK